MKIIYLTLSILLISCNDDQVAKASKINIDPNIKVFLKENPSFHTKYGKFINAENAPDWAHGRRQWLHYKNGSLLIYVDRKGEVASVKYKKSDSDNAPKYLYKSEKKYSAIEKPSDNNDNKYYFVHQFINLMNGGRHADVILKDINYNRDTPIERKLKIAKFLVSELGVTELSIYNSIEAYKSDASSSYSSMNPEAAYGIIGSVRNNQFYDYKNYSGVSLDD